MLKVSQIQLSPKLGDLSYNLKNASKLIQKSKSANLVILPELANTGYNFLDRKQAVELADTATQSKFIEMLVETAKQQQQFIISGFHELEGDELFNTSIFVGPNGEFGKYRKIHLFMNEKDIFSKGNLGLPIFEMNGIKLGMLICFDYLFPEVWRIMGLKGVQIVAHPSNLVTYKAFKVVPAQAVINRFFIFTTNRIGTERDVSFSGRTFAVDPEGDVIAEASAEKEEVLCTTIDPILSLNKMITVKNHVMKDRFPDEYSEMF